MNNLITLPNGNSIKFIPIYDHICNECGASNQIDYKHLPSNNAIRASCGACGRFVKFVKHDIRQKEDIRHEKIKKWLYTKEERGLFK